MTDPEIRELIEEANSYGVLTRPDSFAKRVAAALTALIERRDELELALRLITEELTCCEDNLDAHYCPNCDNSLYDALEMARAALGGRSG